jgi:hypothetical protein
MSNDIFDIELWIDNCFFNTVSPKHLQRFFDKYKRYIRHISWGDFEIIIKSIRKDNYTELEIVNNILKTLYQWRGGKIPEGISTMKQLKDFMDNMSSNNKYTSYERERFKQFILENKIIRPYGFLEKMSMFDHFMINIKKYLTSLSHLDKVDMKYIDMIDDTVN